MVNFLGLAENSCIGARKWIVPNNFFGLKYAPQKLEKDVAEFTTKTTIVGVPLDKTSTEAIYFGVDSPEHITEKISNHHKLYKAKKRWCINWNVGEVLDFGSWNISKIGFDKLKNYLGEQIRTSIGNWSQIQELKSQRAARISFFSNIFGKDKYGYPGIHTIGLVNKNGNLYILDSLGEQIPELKMFHQKLIDIFKDFGYNKIIVSTKPQQPMSEYTCNNWTYANIKSVLDALIGKRISIDTSEELNKILQEDINKILKEQYDAAIWVDLS